MNNGINCQPQLVFFLRISEASTASVEVHVCDIQSNPVIVPGFRRIGSKGAFEGAYIGKGQGMSRMTAEKVKLRKVQPAGLQHMRKGNKDTIVIHTSRQEFLEVVK